MAGDVQKLSRTARPRLCSSAATNRKPARRFYARPGTHVRLQLLCARDRHALKNECRYIAARACQRPWLTVSSRGAGSTGSTAASSLLMDALNRVSAGRTHRPASAAQEGTETDPLLSSAPTALCPEPASKQSAQESFAARPYARESAERPPLPGRGSFCASSNDHASRPPPLEDAADACRPRMGRCAR